MSNNQNTSDEIPDPIVAEKAQDPYALPVGSRIDPRKITLTPAEKIQLDNANASGGINPDVEGVGTPTYRTVGRRQGFGSDPMPDRTVAVYPEYQYFGTQLVGINGKLEREQYQTGDEAQPELAVLSNDERLELLRKLKTYGFYGSGDVSGSGLLPEDINAFQKLLIESNGRGRTWQGTLVDLLFTKPSSTGQRIRYTPKQDVRANFKQVFLSDVGRSATEAEISKFEAAYRGIESAAGTTQIAPTIDAAAVESIGMNNKAEEQANGFLQVAQTFERLLRG